MSTELTMLATIGGFALILTMIQGTRNVLVLGLPTAAGNQHNIAPWTGWHDRLNRAVRNLGEAIVIFAPIAFAVHALDASNEFSSIGAELFVFARVLHAVVFVLGIPYLRTIAWFTGVVGTLMVASALFG